jgi:uncharacterized protein (TIGR03790 family)
MPILRLLCFVVCYWLSPGLPLAADTLLRPADVAVVVNEADPNSLAVGRHYLEARRIPPANLVRVSIPGRPGRLGVEAFAALKAQIEGQLAPAIQVVVLAWSAPYAVDCNSITAALTLGYDAGQCVSTCRPGQPSRYFDSAVRRPHAQAGLRLSMLLPADDPELARRLIDRARLSGFRPPSGGAYFLTTGDAHRNSRAAFFPPSGTLPGARLEIHNLQAESIRDRDDVMLYQTGAAQVPHLDSLGFLPGALADHLTSFGGDLAGSGQMSVLRWLEAGATASYGTVSEPCNYWQKFPQPTVLLRHYLSGESAVEAYWKSVAWPAQGLFVGEPLAAPYCTACRRDEIGGAGR